MDIVKEVFQREINQMSVEEAKEWLEMLERDYNIEAIEGFRYWKSEEIKQDTIYKTELKVKLLKMKILLEG